MNEYSKINWVSYFLRKATHIWFTKIDKWYSTFSSIVRSRDELWTDSGDWWTVLIEKFHQKETKVGL